jgi:FeS assembly SUF system protein
MTAMNAENNVLPEPAEIVAAIRKIYDPEIPVNIYDLGLIYKLNVDQSGAVEVDMTLTAPACPVAGTLPGEVGRMIETVPGVSEAVVRLVWDPPWRQELMTDEARLELGLL